MYPIVFQIPTPFGALTLYAHGACLALATLAGWYLWVKPVGTVPRAARAKLYVAAVCGGIVTGKVGTSMIGGGAIFEGGIDVPSILLGALFVGWIMRGPHTARMGDDAAPVAALFVALTSLGQWLHGAAFGRQLAGPAWLERLGTYPAWANETGSPAWRAHIDRFDSELVASLPTHPVQLYEVAIAITLAAVVVWRRPPHALALVLGVLGALHIALEPLRAQTSAGAYLAPLAVVMIALALRRGQTTSA